VKNTTITETFINNVMITTD